MATVVGTGVSVTPPSSSRATLARQVIDYIQGGNDQELLDLAAREINTSIDEINCRNWEKLVTSQSITLVADDDEYELDPTFKDPMQARLLNTSGRYSRLVYEPFRRFMEIFPDRGSTTSPDFYTIDYVRRLLILQGKPSSDFVSTFTSIDLQYYRRLAHLSVDSESHVGPPEFNAFLVWQARANVCAIRGEQRLATYAETKARSIMRELRASDNNIQTDWE